MGLIRVGLVGTGYAAKLRAETLQADGRARLIAVTGHTPEQTVSFAQMAEAEPLPSWRELVQADVDLVIIATINRDHGAIARAALQAGKHVVVEYPLSLDVAEAEELIALAQQRQLLLHIEHIELLSGIHQAIATALPHIGNPLYVRYASINPQRPAPRKWTYHPDLFGFPLIGALSRIHRLTHLFGPVAQVQGQARFWHDAESQPHYTTCLCSAQLQFASGLLADVVYGKGEALWRAERGLDIHGQRGGIIFDGEQAYLIQPDSTTALDVGSRRGLFAKDTQAVLDHLTTGEPLYVSAASSLHALRVADAARYSAETGQTVALE